MKDDITPLEGAIIMVKIIIGMGILIYTLSFLNVTNKAEKARWLPPKLTNLPKYEFECWALKYTCFWISVFAVVIFTKAYEQFTATTYMVLCSGLAAPFAFAANPVPFGV